MTTVFDNQYFSDATVGDLALQREVADLFRGQAPTWRARLEDAAPQVRADAAHTIKGSARGMGLHALAGICEVAEQSGGADLEAIGTVLAALDDTRAALDAWQGDA